MQSARFIFVTVRMPGTASTDTPREGIAWMLLSPNNRRLGRSDLTYDSYLECRNDAVRLSQDYAKIEARTITVDSTGQWIWRADLDGIAVAVSSRSYLRARECTYSLDRFLEALPRAQIMPGTRVGLPPNRVSAERPGSLRQTSPAGS